MIKLENIVRKGNLISAHVIINEGAFETFDIVVDIDEEVIISHTRGRIDMFVSHARTKLTEIGLTSTEKNTPKTATAVWY